MKPSTLFFTCLAAAAITAGCEKRDTTSQQLDQLQEKTAAAAQDLKDYTFAQKAEFIQKMGAQLAEINQDLDQLAAKVEKSSAAVKAEAQPKLQALREQTARLNAQLDEVKNATESTWDSVKATARKAFEATKEGFNQTRQWVADKIAP